MNGKSLCLTKENCVYPRLKFVVNFFFNILDYFQSSVDLAQKYLLEMFSSVVIRNEMKITKEYKN